MSMKIDLVCQTTPDDSAQSIFENILASRGLKTKEDREEFLNPPFPELDYLINSLSLKRSELGLASDIIKSAIKNQTPICVYGDYDVDGITSTAILWETLHKMGAKALPFIPHRAKHGYGLSLKGLKEVISGSAFANSPLHPFKPGLIITVDNGIVAQDEVVFLKDKGIQVILTDHHQLEEVIPPADAIIHSTVTSGAGISWLLSLYLSQSSPDVLSMIDLATVGIVADMVPLTGVNRSIVYHGLEKLAHTKRLGLQTLMQTSGTADKKLTTYDISFALAPRINAMGRMKHALEALRLLVATDAKKSRQLASLIESENKLRQDETARSLKDAKCGVTEGNLLIVASDAYHEGVIGLVAGKLVEEYHRPAIVISIDGDSAKGSARSIKGFDITAALRKARKYLTSVGGHKMAAGFSIKTENIESFTKFMGEIAQLEITEEMLIKSHKADAKLSLRQTTKQLYSLLHKMEPFGIGNPRPTFVSSDFNVLETRKMGTSNQHQKLVLEQSGVTREAVWFNSPDDLTSLSSLLYYLDLNTWNGHSKIQLIAKEGSVK